MSDQDNCCKTPLLDLLKDIPEDARAWYEHDKFSSSHIFYGNHAKKAVEEIESLQAENKQLREAMEFIRAYGNDKHNDPVEIATEALKGG